MASFAQTRAFLKWAVIVCYAFSPLKATEMVFKSQEAKPTLLELYSSEGCSSCPPAEAWLNQLKDSPDLWTHLFPLVFHVDYWDRLGWPDRFACPAFTQRQRKYSELLGQDSVYTPEFLVNGREWRGWFQGESVPAAPLISGELTLRVDVDGSQVSASFLPPTGDTARSYTINIALLGFNLTTDVKGGENTGRVLQHDFVVLDFFSKPVVLEPRQKFQSGSFNWANSTTDRPGAAIAWVVRADGSPVQITGGWLRPAPP